MIYKIAEKFKSIQGEGVYTGTPMAFIRFVGCSVGKKICSACDTDFEEPVTWRGGGMFTEKELLDWAGNYGHICLTGGEPLDQDLEPLKAEAYARSLMLHLETSGTKGRELYEFKRTYNVANFVCVSPKPGFIEDAIVSEADEIKVIMPGLGAMKYGNVLPVSFAQVNDGIMTGVSGRWPALDDALRWARAGKCVFIQPRNDRNEIDKTHLKLCQDIVAEHPELRLSVQLHKILKVQ